MDALRRAETQQEQAPASESATTEAPPPADPADMQLEPLDAAAQLVEELETETEAFAVDKPVAPTESPDTEPPARQPKTAAALLGAPAAPWQKKALYFLSGFVTIILLTGVYYIWRSEQTLVPDTAHTATLIEAPDTDRVPPGAPSPETAAPDHRAATVSVPAAPAPAPTRQAAEQTRSNSDVPQTTATQTTQRIEIHRSRRIRAVHPLVQKAYHAYQQQHYVEAEQLYRKALKRNPDSRDAALGLAGIAMHQGKPEVARYYYQRVLKANPADKTARVALNSLGNPGDELRETSQLKHWLQNDPDNAQLHFALGNRYAAARQWKEAQQAYFEAQRIDPEQPDYAFNLAISLDQLGLRKQALDYYRTAQRLAAEHTALFNATQADNRIRQLQRSVENAP